MTERLLLPESAVQDTLEELWLTSDEDEAPSQVELLSLGRALTHQYPAIEHIISSLEESDGELDYEFVLGAITPEALARDERLCEFLSLVHAYAETQDEEESIETVETPEMDLYEVTEDEYLAGLDDAIQEGPTSIYMKEIRLIPLLTAEQEVELGKRKDMMITAMKQLSQCNGDKAKRRALKKVIAEGKRAWDQLVAANQRLVVSVAKRYIGKGVEFLDLIQEGNFGLMKATTRWEHTRGHKFSTFSTWWIRQCVSRAVENQGRTIRVPVKTGRTMGKLYRIAHELEQEYGRPATFDEIAEEYNDQTKEQRTGAWVGDLMQRSLFASSLDRLMYEEDGSDGTTPLNRLKDEASPDPVALTTYQLLKEHLAEAMACLSPRHRKVLEFLFGLETGESITLEEIGKKMKVTRERIRQLKEEAFDQLKTSPSGAILREYLGD